MTRPSVRRDLLPLGLRRLWLSPAGASALVVITVMTVWRSMLLGHGWFSQNDFLVVSGLDDAWSVQFTAGFAPAAFVLANLVSDVAPLSWPVAAAVVVTAEAATVALLWVVLTRLLGSRWLRVPILVVFAVGPLTLWTTQWWTFALQFWPAALAVLTATYAVLRGLQDRWRPAPVVAAVATAVALGFNERWVLLPILLLGLSLAIHPATTARGRIAAVLRGLGGTWVLQLLVIGGYLSLRSVVAPLDLGRLQPPGQLITAYARHVGAELLGGPWGTGVTTHAYLVPETWTVGAGVLTVLALVALCLQHGGVSARVSVATLVVYVAASVGVLVLLRQGSLASSLDLIHRFGADFAVAFAVLLAGALRETTIRLPAAVHRWVSVPAEAALAGVLSVAFLASTWVSTEPLAVGLYHQDDRQFVANARADLRADPQAVILDAGVPAGVVSPWFGPAAAASTVLRSAPEKPVFDLPSQRLRMVDPTGHLVPVVLGGAVEAKTTDNAACPYPVRFEGLAVPMAGRIPQGRWVLRLGYYTSQDSVAVVDVAGTQILVPVRTGLNATDVVVTGSFDEFRMSLQHPSATLCLATATVGVPTPGVRTG